MTRYSRRGALAAGASTLAALAGCSSLPVVGGNGGDSLPAYDELAIADAIQDDPVATPDTYPGPVPASLLATHRERARDLLDSVPAAPSVPNEAVTDRLRDLRARADNRWPDSAQADPTLRALADWRLARTDAAEVAYAYRAATGDLDEADVEAARVEVRDRFRTLNTEGMYVGEDRLDALAVGYELDACLADARHHLAPDQSFPADPRSEPFRAGEVAAGLEETRGHLDTVAGLRDAHREPGMADYWNDVAGAAARLADVRHATVDRVAPFLFDDADAREVLGGEASATAVELLDYGIVAADNSAESAASARNSGNYAAAVVDTARSLVDTLATGRAIDASRTDDYDAPADAATVEAERDAAVAALRDAASTTPTLLTALTVAPSARRLQYADERLQEDPSDRTVARESARYTYISYAAGAIPAVVDRVARALGVETE